MHKNKNHFNWAKCFLTFFFIMSFHLMYAQEKIDSTIEVENQKPEKNKKAKIGQVYSGVASFYGNKFIGKKTASGEIFSQEKYTAACNVLPLGTWIKVTNIKNGKSVVVKTNDRLHPKMKRIVDLTMVAAHELGYVGKGLAKVKVEVIEKPKKKSKSKPKRTKASKAKNKKK
jgi:rare lipoprotein A